MKQLSVFHAYVLPGPRPRAHLYTQPSLPSSPAKRHGVCRAREGERCDMNSTTHKQGSTHGRQCLTRTSWREASCPNDKANRISVRSRQNGVSEKGLEHLFFPYSSLSADSLIILNIHIDSKSFTLLGPLYCSQLPFLLPSPSSCLSCCSSL